MHISQFEKGYPKLINISSCNIKHLKVTQRLQDFVLDTYSNIRLKNNYNFQIKEYKHEKYNGYKIEINKLSRNDMNSYINKILAIEIAYIYFNDDKSLAQKLITKIDRRLTHEVIKFYQSTIFIMNKYIKESSENCYYCFNELLALYELTSFFKTECS